MNDIDYTTSYVGKDGEPFEKDGFLVGAKLVVTNLTQNQKYYLKRGNGTLYNPFNLSKHEYDAVTWKWVRVNPQVYRMYTNFLNSASNVMLKNAERAI